MGKLQRARNVVHGGPVAEPAAVTGQAIVATIALVGVILLAYWPALHGALLWDDTGHLTKPVLENDPDMEQSRRLLEQLGAQAR